MMTAYVTIQASHSLPGGRVTDAGVNDDGSNAVWRQCCWKTV
jgi:hypothetical protein